MSFHWDLSSDEENGFDDWANVDLNESLALTAARSTAVASRPAGDDDDDEDGGSSSSSDDEDDRNPAPSHFAGVAFCNDFDDGDDDEDEDVDWEDASDKLDPTTTTARNEEKLATDMDGTSGDTLSKLRPVTLDWTTAKRNHRPTKRKQRPSEWLGNGTASNS
jgi:hypothetical protein